MGKCGKRVEGKDGDLIPSTLTLLPKGEGNTLYGKVKIELQIGFHFKSSSGKDSPSLPRKLLIVRDGKEWKKRRGQGMSFTLNPNPSLKGRREYALWESENRASNRTSF